MQFYRRRVGLELVYIPLHNGMTSVGVVMNEVASSQRKEAAKRANGWRCALAQAALFPVPAAQPRSHGAFWANGQLVEDGMYPVVQSASDFSYNAPTYFQGTTTVWLAMRRVRSFSNAGGYATSLTRLFHTVSVSVHRSVFFRPACIWDSLAG